ncbi:hypothetical protein [Cecembia calidifontis]|nr:hypothetical protein [Cecembia calidifontis]
MSVLEISNFEERSLGLKSRYTLEMGVAHFMDETRLDIRPERNE